jgi:hypothetical protein
MGDEAKRLIKAEHKLDVEYRVREGQAEAVDVKAARKAIEEAVKGIPDTALKGLKSFRVSILA